MNNHLDQQLREKAQQIHMELPEVIRQRIDQTLSNLPDQSDRKNDNRPAKFPHKKKYSILKWAVSAVVIISLIAGVAWYKVPAFADIIRSVFTDKSGPDYGLLNARELGLVQHPDIKVQSNGYTIKVGEAIADPTRVIMALEVYGPDGKMDRDLFFNHDAILVKDEIGKVVGTMYDVGATTDVYYMIVSFAEPLQTQNITIESNITSMRQSGEQNKIYGDWKFKYTIDLTKANQQTQIVPLKGTYISPDGMTISLKRITRMVQGVRLEIDSQLSAKALRRSPGESWKKQELRFHVEDAAGNPIIGADSASYNPNMLASQHIAGKKRGEMHWSYTFSQLPVDKPYYLVIDGYLVKERDGHQVTFDPAHADYPIHFDSMGDYLEMGAYRINHEGDDPARPLEGTFPVTGTVRNGLGDDEYIALDEQGRRYKVNGRGGYTIMPDSHSAGIVLSEVAYEDSSDMGYELRIQGLDKVPEQLTFIRAKTMRWYGNTDGKIKIQELKSKDKNRLEKK